VFRRRTSHLTSLRRSRRHLCHSIFVPMECGEHWPKRYPGHARKVLLMIQKETKTCRRKDCRNFEESRNRNIARRPLRRSAQQRTSARRLHSRKNEKESDQNPGRRSRDGRSLALRSGKGAIDLSPQGRTCRIAVPSAAASPVSAAMTGRSQIRCGPRHERDASWTASVAAIGTPN
jgi:hypothetical protein